MTKTIEISCLPSLSLLKPKCINETLKNSFSSLQIQYSDH